MKRILERPCVILTEEEKPIYEENKNRMYCILAQAKNEAYNVIEEVKAKAQSEIMKRNEGSAVGILNTRLDVQQERIYNDLCKENGVPKEVKDLFAKHLLTYK